MQKIVDGIRDFQSRGFAEHKTLFEELRNGQSPQALFITCSDSRIDPNLLTQTKPGELFIQRTAGNIVPPYGAVSGGEAATIEYAVAALKVKDIIVCGHSHCGAMAGLLKPESLTGLPAVGAYLEHASATRRIIDENHGDLPEGDERLHRTVEENVLVQLENLRTHPSVAAALARGDVSLHGWVYRFETGEVFTYDPEEMAFTSIGERVRPAVSKTRYSDIA